MLFLAVQKRAHFDPPFGKTNSIRRVNGGELNRPSTTVPACGSPLREGSRPDQTREASPGGSEEKLLCAGRAEDADSIAERTAATSCAEWPEGNATPAQRFVDTASVWDLFSTSTDRCPTECSHADRRSPCRALRSACLSRAPSTTHVWGRESSTRRHVRSSSAPPHPHSHR